MEERIDTTIGKILDYIDGLDFSTVSAYDFTQYAQMLSTISGIYSQRKSSDFYSSTLSMLGSLGRDCCCKTGLSHDVEAPAEAGEVNA